MKTLAIITGFIWMINTACLAQKNDEAEVKQLLNEQVAAWNNGDLRGFMQ